MSSEIAKPPPSPADTPVEPTVQNLDALFGALPSMPISPPASAMVTPAPRTQTRDGKGDDGKGHAWAAVILVVLLFGSACAMLFTGHAVLESLALAGGLTLLGVGIARRILTAGGLLPTIVIAGAIIAFAVVLLVRGYEITEVAMICGGGGLIASEVIGWVLRTTSFRREV